VGLIIVARMGSVVPWNLGRQLLDFWGALLEGWMFQQEWQACSRQKEKGEYSHASLPDQHWCPAASLYCDPLLLRRLWRPLFFQWRRWAYEKKWKRKIFLAAPASRHSWFPQPLQATTLLLGSYIRHSDSALPAGDGAVALRGVQDEGAGAGGEDPGEAVTEATVRLVEEESGHIRGDGQVAPRERLDIELREKHDVECGSEEEARDRVHAPLAGRFGNFGPGLSTPDRMRRSA
jgi:hypothetical protein